jgi:4,5-dihydroxyphthalate decarboxylase
MGQHKGWVYTRRYFPSEDLSMTAKPRAITLATNRTPLTIPLLDGEVSADGVDLQGVQSKSIDDTSRRMLDQEFDFAEMSLGTFVRGVDRGVPLVAVPIFTNSRQFLSVNMHVSSRSGIRDLGELRGRTLGAPQYWTASSLWQRQFLREFYGLDAADMAWVTFQPERMEGLDVPAGVRHRLEDSGKTPDEAAEAGEIDAFTTGGGRRDQSERPPALVPLFPDRAAAQRDYYQRTGIYPVQYVIATRAQLAEDEPEVVASVCQAFVWAKELAASRGPLGSPDVIELIGDAWPYGLSANRRTLEAFLAEAHRQGATIRQFSVAEVFAQKLPDFMS